MDMMQLNSAAVGEDRKSGQPRQNSLNYFCHKWLALDNTWTAAMKFFVFFLVLKKNKY